MTVVERKYTTIQRDSEGKVIRGYEGVDMKEVYANKPLLYKLLKRFFDIIISVLALIILSPVFMIIAIAIKLEDGGPVIFSGQRWGKDFKYFPIPFDRKKFMPHITLARKIEYDKGFPTDSPFPAAMDVEYISLMRSDRGRNGMIYTNMGDFGCN